MNEEFIKKFNEAKSISDIFEVVKDVVWSILQKSRAGLDLGMIELGNLPNGLIGAYYVIGSNIIVMNETPLKRIKETDPKLLAPYTFSVLLHEYLHSLGVFSDEMINEVTFDVSKKAFGEDNVITQISKDMTKFFPDIIYPQGVPQTNEPIKLVKDFDKSDTRYIG
jgi:hypothetical protein